MHFLNRKDGRHARLGLSINKKPLRHYFLRHSGSFMGSGELCCPVDILLKHNCLRLLPLTLSLMFIVLRKLYAKCGFNMT